MTPALRAREAGLIVVMDRCMLKEHRKGGSQPVEDPATLIAPRQRTDPGHGR